VGWRGFKRWSAGVSTGPKKAPEMNGEKKKKKKKGMFPRNGHKGRKNRKKGFQGQRRDGGPRAQLSPTPNPSGSHNNKKRTEKGRVGHTDVGGGVGYT